MTTRRDVLRTLGYAAGAYAVAACGSPDAPIEPDPQDGGDLCGPEAPAWASGGTAAMTAKACYPDPFAVPLASCPLEICATTAGPCTAAAPERGDISEGMPGLPVRLALQIVEADACTPIAGAVVEIWHTQIAGVYSGVTPSPAQCARGDATAESRSYFRGTQTTGAAGRVDFDTCFPGWYPGRAIHFHVRVAITGTDVIVSQLFFGELLTREIFDSHPDYAPTGQPDTTNATDGVLTGVDSRPYLLGVARMSDGAMLASKVIAVRRPGQAAC